MCFTLENLLKLITQSYNWLTLPSLQRWSQSQKKCQKSKCRVKWLHKTFFQRLPGTRTRAQRCWLAFVCSPIEWFGAPLHLSSADNCEPLLLFDDRKLWAQQQREKRREKPAKWLEAKTSADSRRHVRLLSSCLACLCMPN